MTRSQRLAFFLNGLVFLLCGGVMIAVGAVHDVTVLLALGGGFILSGGFWILLARLAGRSR